VTGLLARAMQPWLSAWTIVAVAGGKSVSKVHSHMASLVALDDAMYSASTREVATVACFFEDQEIELPAISKTKPLVEQ